MVSATLLIVRANLAGQAGIPFFPHCSKVFPLEAEHSVKESCSSIKGIRGAERPDRTSEQIKFAFRKPE